MKAELDYNAFIDEELVTSVDYSPLNTQKFLENDKVIPYSQPWNHHLCHTKINRILNLHQAIKMLN